MVDLAGVISSSPLRRTRYTPSHWPPSMAKPAIVSVSRCAQVFLTQSLPPGCHGAPCEDRYLGAVAGGRATDTGQAAFNPRRRMRTTGTLPATVSGLLERLLRQAAASASRRDDAPATRVWSSTARISFPFSSAVHIKPSKRRYVPPSERPSIAVVNP